MRSKAWRCMAGIAILAVAASMGAVAQEWPHVRFDGTIGDYTPESNVGGPWVVRGDWSLRIDPDGKADFSAELTMVRSDEGTLLQPGGLDSASARKAHTHHIKLLDGTLTPISHGFEVQGTATLSADGKTPPNPPFSSASIPLKIDITGGDLVKFSNIQLFFGGDAAKHFGPQAVHGVVKNFR